jgi:pilus assembly protein CpaB
MTNRAFTISFVVAALAVSMVYSYVSSTEESYKLMYGTQRSVVVATRDIKELDTLDETNMKLIPLPEKFVQPGTSQNLKDFVGGLALAPIAKDEQITRTKITPIGARSGLARQVAMSKRGVTVRVSDESAVAKLIKPGDRVDVIAQVDPTGSGNKLAIETRTILQDVMVLATGKYVTNTLPGILETDPMRPGEHSKVRLSEYTAYPNVTLEVDPYQAQVLVFAERNLNGVYLSLRNNDDNQKEDLPKIRMQDLLGKDALVAPGAGQAGARH